MSTEIKDIRLHTTKDKSGNLVIETVVVLKEGINYSRVREILTGIEKDVETGNLEKKHGKRE